MCTLANRWPRVRHGRGRFRPGSWLRLDGEELEVRLGFLVRTRAKDERAIRRSRYAFRFLCVVSTVSTVSA